MMSVKHVDRLQNHSSAYVGNLKIFLWAAVIPQQKCTVEVRALHLIKLLEHEDKHQWTVFLSNKQSCMHIQFHKNTSKPEPIDMT